MSHTESLETIYNDTMTYVMKSWHWHYKAQHKLLKKNNYIST